MLWPRLLYCSRLCPMPSTTSCQPPSEPLRSLARRFDLVPRTPQHCSTRGWSSVSLQMFLPSFPFSHIFPPLLDLAFPLFPLPQLSASQPACQVCMQVFEEQVIVRENAPTWHGRQRRQSPSSRADREEIRRSHQNISALFDTASLRGALALILASNHATGFLALFFQDL